MRQFFRMLLLALVLMTVALISALTAMQLAIHGSEVAIPNLINMTPNEAERSGAASGLRVLTEQQFYSADIPEGKIMTQMPPPGTKVRRGWSVRVAQSLGPQRVSIPDVTGGSERVAELNISRRGLTLGSIAHVSLTDTSEGSVVAQSPPAKAVGVAAPKINLLVSNGPPPLAYVMPDLTGQLLGTATISLQQAGMKVGKVTMQKIDEQLVSTGDTQSAPAAPLPASGPGPASIIVTQTPPAGQKIIIGSAVDFEVR